MFVPSSCRLPRRSNHPMLSSRLPAFASFQRHRVAAGPAEDGRPGWRNDLVARNAEEIQMIGKDSTIA